MCCGGSYIAHSMSSCYCSEKCRREKENEAKRNRRAIVRAQRLKQQMQELSPAEQHIKEYLNLKELSSILGVCKMTAFRYVASGKIKGRLLGKSIFVRKTALDAFFENSSEYHKRKYRRKNEVSEYYTVKQIVEKFHLCKKAVLSRCERFNIAKVYEGRNVYFRRTAIDEHFAELIEEIDLANYYTILQVMEKFCMSKANVLTFVSHHQIPRITRGRTVYYSKVHIDSFKRKGEGIDVNWYTYAEIMDSYGLSKDQIRYYIQHEHLKTERRGKFTMIWRTDFDEKVVKARFNNAERDESGRLMFTSQDIKAPESTPAHPIDYTPQAPEGYYSTQELCTKYAMNAKLLRKYMHSHNVPNVRIKGFVFFSIAEADAIFAKRYHHEDVDEWLTGEQMQEQYNMTGDACRSFVHRHGIPTKVEYGVTYYSKTHIDRVKGRVFEGVENYYTVNEASEKYRMTKDQVFYYVKQYRIPKVHFGHFLYILKSKFDEIAVKSKQDRNSRPNLMETERLLSDDCSQQ